MAIDEVADLLAELKKIPGWERFPLPDSVYKHFNIPKPQPYDGLMDYFKDAGKAAFLGSDEIQIRLPVDGGVREVPDAPKVEIEILNQTISEVPVQAADGEACPEHQTQSVAEIQCSASSDEHQT